MKSIPEELVKGERVSGESQQEQNAGKKTHQNQLNDENCLVFIITCRL